MDFWKAILGLARRKIIIIPLLLASIAAALAGYFLMPLRYVSSTTVVLIPPARAGISKDPRTFPMTNPMLNYDNNLKAVSSILIQAMNTPEVAAELGAGDGSPTQLTVDDGRSSPQPLDGAPFVYIVGKSTSAAAAKGVVIQAEERVRQDLVDRQWSLGAPPETYLTLVDVVAPTIPKAIKVERIKVAGIALALSLISGLGAAYAWQSRRAGRGLTDEEYAAADHGLAVEAEESAQPENADAVAEEQLTDEEYAAADHGLAVEAEESAQPENADAVAEEQLTDEEYAAADHGLAVEAEESAQPENADAVAEEQLTDEEYAAADHGLAVEAEESAQPENAAYAFQGEQGNEIWDLYWDLSVGHSPADEGKARGSQDDELVWSLEGIDYGRDSEAVGTRRSR